MKQTQLNKKQIEEIIAIAQLKRGAYYSYSIGYIACLYGVTYQLVWYYLDKCGCKRYNGRPWHYY